VLLELPSQEVARHPQVRMTRTSVDVTLFRARADVRREGIAAPPATLRDAHYRGAADRGHGEGYVSPHDDPSRAGIDHLPESVRGRAYYVPSANGEEAEEALGGDRDG